MTTSTIAAILTLVFSAAAHDRAGVTLAKGHNVLVRNVINEVNSIAAQST